MLCGINYGFLIGIVTGFIFSGIPWGWKIVTFIQPKMFLFMSFGGWVVYFLIKFVLSCFAGIVALPIGLVRLIISLVSANKKEQNINDNLATEQQ
jgi:hypothetical protein